MAIQDQYVLNRTRRDRQRDAIKNTHTKKNDCSAMSDTISSSTMLASLSHPLLLIILIALLAISPACPQSDESVPQAAPGQYVSDYITLGGEMTELYVSMEPNSFFINLNPRYSPAIVHGSIVATEGEMWQITVSCTNDGYMTEYDTVQGAYVLDGNRLKSPATISAEGGSTLDLSTLDSNSSSTLISGSGDATIPITVIQPVSWSDKILTEGRNYRIAITLTEDILE